MRKIPSYLDNPIDNLILLTANVSTDILYNLGLTPNGITTLSLLTGLLSIYKFTQGKYYLSAATYALSYYFDCLDGHMARRYKMTSKFGDYYDHIKDILVGFLLLYYVGSFYYKIQSGWKYISLIIPLLILLSCVQIGCQEIYVSDDNTNLLNSNELNSNELIGKFKDFCPAKNKKETIKLLHLTRYFGSGSLILTICGLIALCECLKQYL
jgi:hypothetical protein